LVTGRAERKEKKTSLKMVIYNIFCISIRLKIIAPFSRQEKLNICNIAYFLHLDE